MENYFWASGPTCMRLPVADWPIREQRFFDESGEEVDSIKCLVSTEETETHPLYDMVMRLSSYTTILRVTVWVLHFVKILTVKSFITLSDMNRAEVALVRIVQGKYFKSDIKLLNSGKEISNRLRKLNPFLQNGILMGGRLENAPLTFVARHPIILPGTMNTPQLLMLSGVGPKEEQDKVGIYQIHELPGSGKNLTDHVALGVTCVLRKTITYNEMNWNSITEYLKARGGPLSASGNHEEGVF
ncbi:hypothetical protein JTB14_032834 [Gonioctena quinquepunctata]|nr:hypothetical protein JTB14_032834 [Gonioctena quinquepunctata]